MPGGGWGVSRCAGAPFLELRRGSQKVQRERLVVRLYVEFGGLEPAITARTWAWTLSWQAGNVHLGGAGLEFCEAGAYLPIATLAKASRSRCRTRPSEFNILP